MGDVMKAAALCAVIPLLYVYGLTGREKCDACLTVMDEQQVLWEEYAKAHPAEVRKGRFKLTDDMDKKITGMCDGERYKRYSKPVTDGCRQLTSNVKMKV